MTLSLKIKTFLLVAAFGIVSALPASATEIGGRSVFDAVNSERIAQNLPALAPNASLVRAAQLKADEMARLHYFAHQSPTGRNLWVLIGLANGRGFRVAGDNLAVGFTTTEALTASWMKSPTHRKNILDRDYRFTGIAIARDGEKLIIVQFFAY